MELYGLRWMQFNKHNRLAAKQKYFTTEAGRAAFITKLLQKPNFHEILSYQDPTK
jgi:hypothetical protein